MGKIVSLKADIPASRELRILLPADIPTGPAEIVLFVSSSDSSSASTLSELADSEFFGMWRDRLDIDDGVEFARDLRSQGWKR